MWKRGEIAPRSNFSSFPQYFQYISNFRGQYTYSCIVVVRFIFSSILQICCVEVWISKYFRESFGLQQVDLYFQTGNRCSVKISGSCHLGLIGDPHVNFQIPRNGISDHNGPEFLADQTRTYRVLPWIEILFLPRVR